MSDWCPPANGRRQTAAERDGTGANWPVPAGQMAKGSPSWPRTSPRGHDEAENKKLYRQPKTKTKAGAKAKAKRVAGNQTKHDHLLNGLRRHLSCHELASSNFSHPSNWVGHQINNYQPGQLRLAGITGVEIKRSPADGLLGPVCLVGRREPEFWPADISIEQANAPFLFAPAWSARRSRQARMV